MDLPSEIRKPSAGDLIISMTLAFASKVDRTLRYRSKPTSHSLVNDLLASRTLDTLHSIPDKHYSHNNLHASRNQSLDSYVLDATRTCMITPCEQAIPRNIARIISNHSMISSLANITSQTVSFK